MSRNRVSVEFVLPCGHVLQAAWGRRSTTSLAVDYSTQPENYQDQLLAAAEDLTRWLETRAAKHVCHLVTDDNPFGLPRAN